MNSPVVIDHKSIIAVGVAVSAIIFAMKLDPEAAKDVSLRLIGALEANAIAVNRIHLSA